MTDDQTHPSADDEIKQKISKILGEMNIDKIGNMVYMDTKYPVDELKALIKSEVRAALDSIEVPKKRGANPPNGRNQTIEEVTASIERVRSRYI